MNRKNRFTMEKDTSFHCRLLLMLAVLLASWTWPACVQSQDRTIHGVVLDENNQPLPAAHVKLIGDDAATSATGTITDVDGNFTLKLPSSAQAIEISVLGYEPQRVKLTRETNYQIILVPATELLDEVVVTGYQTISKERATGAFSKVDAKKLETQRLNDVSSMLEGHVAGFSDGQIRGVTSMNGLTTPLYVIDGFPVEKTTNDGYGNWVESVPDINVEDIESITVLKDAAATSIYGARAANGVVVITTKRAKKNQMNVSFSATLTVQPYDYYTGHLANAADMIDLESEWFFQNPNLTTGTDAEIRQNAQTILNNMTYQSQGIRNWLKYALQYDVHRSAGVFLRRRWLWPQLPRQEGPQQVPAHK